RGHAQRPAPPRRRTLIRPVGRARRGGSPDRLAGTGPARRASAGIVESPDATAVVCTLARGGGTLVAPHPAVFARRIRRACVAFAGWSAPRRRPVYQTGVSKKRPATWPARTDGLLNSTKSTRL